jgi:hypothetical protein
MNARRDWRGIILLSYAADSVPVKRRMLERQDPMDPTSRPRPSTGRSLTLRQQQAQGLKEVVGRRKTGEVVGHR